MEDDANLKSFGQAVRTLRKRIGLSQESLAFKSELDRTYVGGVERGERNISLINIIKISKALNVNPSDLFKLLEEQNAET